MPYHVTRKAWTDGRRALIGWTLGTAFFVFVYASSFSGFKDDRKQAADVADRVPSGVGDFMGGIGDLSTGAGYLQTVVFQFFAPLLIIGCALVWATSAIAGPEESGHADVLLSLPISRRRYLLEWVAALVGALSLVALAVWLTVLANDAALDMGVGVAGTTAVSLGLLGVGLFFGAFALAVSAFTGRRATTLAVTGTVALATYLLYTLGREYAAIEPLRWLSPFHYYLGGSPLQDGLHPGHLLALALMSGAAVGIAVLAFERRDIRT
ncbi:hypothetical protein E0L36_16220 [Streptomyces sp. AJS327]|uniref:ABC transporter permease subunit n=1 Tax=Streptomyces sp. AJS327 TaxID=2545265 RepID=UPI0015E00D68|nr:ABC transporter permease subunit [Streptomyces sp. AJS327]MBA0052400.1 hypothetical protein [Streptomyces sp. AJS327]